MPFLSTYTYLPHSYLPTYLIIPSGPLGAISDLHTERHDGFTARLCVRRRYTRVSAEDGVGLSRAEPNQAELSWSAFARRLCSILLLFQEVRGTARTHTNSDIAMRCIFSFSYSSFSLRVYGNSCSLHSTRNTNCPFVDKFIVVFSSLRIICSSRKNVAKIDFWIYVFRYITSTH